MVLQRWILLTEPNLHLSFLSLKINGFRSYVDLYVKDKLDETGVALKVVNETVNDRWEVCLTLSEKGFQQISFVNSIATTKVSKYQPWKTGTGGKGNMEAKSENVFLTLRVCIFQGGRHIDYVVDQIVSKLIEVVKKKNKAGVSVKPFQVGLQIISCNISNSRWLVFSLQMCAENWLTFLSFVLQVKNHIWVFVNALIENPSFDSQTKENMTLQTKSFGSKCLLSDKFVRAVRTLLIRFQLLTWFLM